MKTSVIEVHDMLSVLSVLGVEKRIGEVPGVESVTVNYAAESATVRYDETRLSIADIRSAVRQNGYESEDESVVPKTSPGAQPSTPEEKIKAETETQPPAVGAKAEEPPTPAAVEPAAENPKAEASPTPLAVKPAEESQTPPAASERRHAHAIPMPGDPTAARQKSARRRY